MNRLLVTFSALLLLCLVVPPCPAEQPSIQQVSEDAKIDWTNLVYVAHGEGAMPSPQEEPNRARARLKAREYAKMAAIANLLMAIQGTAISYESTGKDFMADVTIKQKIEGFVQNVQAFDTTEEKVEGSTIITVYVRTPMFKNNGPGQVFLKDAPGIKPAVADPGETAYEANIRVILKPDKILKSPPPEPQSSNGEPYTGLIIDCSGYRLDRCMSPHIRRPDGSEVWGTVKVSSEMALERGIVSYATSLSDAKRNPRAGANPLVIRACGRSGGRFYSDPVITDDDARLLIDENTKSRFLDGFNVVFVKDPVLN